LLATPDRYLVFRQAERASHGSLLFADHLRATSQPQQPAWWREYALGCPWPVLLERRLLADDLVDEQIRRLPLVRDWPCCVSEPRQVRLRRFYMAGRATGQRPLGEHHVKRLNASLAAIGPYDVASFLTECIELLLDRWEASITYMAQPDFIQRWVPLIQRLAAEFAAWTGLAKLDDRIWAPVLGAASDVPHTIVRTALWRIVAATWVATRLLPPAILGGSTDCEYQAALFGDTHLDLLTAAVRYGRTDDAFFLAKNGAVLSAVYPLPHRVCCAEELPDLTPYLLPADLGFDSGRGKKQRTLEQAIIHVFICKMKNNICQSRHLPYVIAKCAADFPFIARLLCLVVHAELLGNVPGATSRLGLMARIRVQLDMADDPLLTPDPARTAAMQQRVVQWAVHRKFLPLFLLREFFVYTCEAHGLIDEYFSQRQEWREYKQIVALGNGALRNELTHQCSERPLAPITWAYIDPLEPRDPHEAALLATLHGNAGVAGALIRRYHHMATRTCQKILKGRIEQLLPKKMIPNEMDVLSTHADRYLARLDYRWHHLAQAIEQGATIDQVFEMVGETPELAAQFRENEDKPVSDPGRLQLADVLRRHVIEMDVLPPVQTEVAALADIMHVVAWAAAGDMTAALRRGEDAVVPLRYLQLLGFDDASRAVVRKWVYDYTVRDVSDNSLKRETYEYGCANLSAFLKLKQYLRLIDLYRNENRVMLLPEHPTRRQYNVLRRRMHLRPHDATLPALGKALLCGCCNKWATWIKPAPIWVDCHYDERMIKAQVAKLKEPDVRLRARDLMRAPLEIGGADCWVAVESGERYCRYGKYAKETLTQQRDSARRAQREVDNASDDDDDDEDDDGDEEDDDDDEEVDNDDAAYAADMQYLELLDPTVRADNADDFGLLMTDAPAVLSQRHLARAAAAIAARQQQQAQAAAAAASAGPEIPATEKKKKVALRTYTTDVIKATMQPVLKPQPRPTCRNDSLLAIDLVGVWYSVGRHLYGLCCYCGDLTTVENEKIITHGLSCMNHPHAAAFRLDHPHMQATLPLDPNTTSNIDHTADSDREGQANPAVDLMERLRRRHPLILDHPVPCAFCHCYLTRTVVREIDAVFCVRERALCRVCLGALRHHIPIAQIGHAAAPMLGLLDAEILQRELDRASVLRRRRRQKQVLDAADGPAMMMIPYDRLGLRDLFRAVKSHPLFRQLLVEDPDADATFHLHVSSAPAREEALKILARKLNDMTGQ